eukprot:GHUV01015064.1.p2 GENE.GHUV01015064.1~~GHUV01015064.1.p2  ORF type:complete len:187 (+),score=39.59 GHUV01015064.1:1786-2346(+)
MAEIASERGHKTIDAQNRGAMSSESGSEDEFQSAGGAGENNGVSNNQNTNNVTSFALDNFSDDHSSDTEYEEAGSDNAAEGITAGLRNHNLDESSLGGSASDAEVMVTPSSSGGGAADPAGSSKAAAGQQQRDRKHKVHQHGHKHGGSGFDVLHVDEGSPAVGVLIDVTVHGHVNVGLIPNPESQA